MSPERAANAAARDDRAAKLARWISNAIVVVSALLVSVSVFVSFTETANTRTDQTDWLFNIIIVVGFAIYAAIGCLIVRRQPRNAIGWLLLFVPLIGSLTVGNGAYTDRLEAVGGERVLTSAPGRGTTVGGRVPLGADR